MSLLGVELEIVPTTLMFGEVVVRQSQLTKITITTTFSELDHVTVLESAESNLETAQQGNNLIGLIQR